MKSATLDLGIYRDERILFVCTQMEGAGVQTRAVNMQKVLANAGVQAKVVFLYKKRPAFEESDDVFCLFPGKVASVRSVVKLIYRLFKVFRGYRPTAVFGMAHYSSQIASIVAAMHGVRNRIATQTNPPSMAPRISRFFDIICGCSGIYTSNICGSNSIIRNFSNYPSIYKSKLRMVYNGVPLRISPVERDVVRARYGIPLDRKVIVTCGRLSRQKNHGFLVRMLVQLKEVDLVLVGDGELRQELQNLAVELAVSDRVHFIGEVQNEQVPDLLKAGDVFAFPSKYEAFGLALVEAMAAGMPVICSDHPALVEVLSGAGYNTPTSDVDLWVAQIREILTSKEHAARLGNAARERALKFELSYMLEGYLKEIVH